MPNQSRLRLGERHEYADTNSHDDCPEPVAPGDRGLTDETGKRQDEDELSHEDDLDDGEFAEPQRRNVECVSHNHEGESKRNSGVFKVRRTADASPPEQALTLLVALCWMTLLSASTAAAIKTRTTPRICALDMAEVSAPECLEGRANPTYVWVCCECRSAKIAPNTAFGTEKRA